MTDYKHYGGFPPHQDTDTSIEAASEILRDAGTLRARVDRYLECCYPAGATDEDIQLYLQMNPSTERPRRIELQQMGLVVDSGERAKTKSGRNAIVWKVQKVERNKPMALPF
jgi:hypothetical protein